MWIWADGLSSQNAVAGTEIIFGVGAGVGPGVGDGPGVGPTCCGVVGVRSQASEVTATIEGKRTTPIDFHVYNNTASSDAFPCADDGTAKLKNP
jgi:hypothetical protein